jgi:hypothetical protein
MALCVKQSVSSNHCLTLLTQCVRKQQESFGALLIPGYGRKIQSGQGSTLAFQTRSPEFKTIDTHRMNCCVPPVTLLAQFPACRARVCCLGRLAATVGHLVATYQRTKSQATPPWRSSAVCQTAPACLRGGCTRSPIWPKLDSLTSEL